MDARSLSAHPARITVPDMDPAIPALIAALATCLIGTTALADPAPARAASAAAEPAAPPEASAAPPSPTPALRISVEIDPADYLAYHGYGLFIGVRPAATAPWRFRIGGGAATLPAFATETNDNNKGWSQRLEPVVTLAAHRAFGSGRNGFFAGAVAGWSSLTFTAPSGGSVDVRNVFAGIDLGYRW